MMLQLLRSPNQSREKLLAPSMRRTMKTKVAQARTTTTNKDPNRVNKAILALLLSITTDNLQLTQRRKRENASLNALPRGRLRSLKSNSKLCDLKLLKNKREKRSLLSEICHI